MTSKVTLFGFGAAALVLAGCGSGSGGSYVGKAKKSIPPATVKTGEEANLFPLKQGNQWTYAIEDRRSDGKQSGTTTVDATLRVSSVNTISEGVEAVMQWVDSSGKPQQTLTWRVTSKGIYQTAGGSKDGKFETPNPQVLFPLNEHQLFNWKGTGPTPTGTFGTTETKSKVLEPQEIDTEQGRMSAIPIESASTFTINDSKGKPVKGASLSTTYWVPGIGIARFRVDWRAGSLSESQLLRLKASVLK